MVELEPQARGIATSILLCIRDVTGVKSMQMDEKDRAAAMRVVKIFSITQHVCGSPGHYLYPSEGMHIRSTRYGSET